MQPLRPGRIFYFHIDFDNLSQRGVDTLIVTNYTTSIYVESTIHDAFYRDYRCLLLTDCTAEPLGSENARTSTRGRPPKNGARRGTHTASRAAAAWLSGGS